MFHLMVRQGTGDKGFITYEGVIASAESNYTQLRLGFEKRYL